MRTKSIPCSSSPTASPCLYACVSWSFVCVCVCGCSWCVSPPDGAAVPCVCLSPGLLFGRGTDWHQWFVIGTHWCVGGERGEWGGWGWRKVGVLQLPQRVPTGRGPLFTVTQNGRSWLATGARHVTFWLGARTADSSTPSSGHTAPGVGECCVPRAWGWRLLSWRGFGALGDGR